MGVERSVTRWYAQRQLLLAEIARLEALQLQKQESAPSMNEKGQTSVIGEQASPLQEQLVAARRRLDTLGHCPKPMMG